MLTVPPANGYTQQPFLLLTTMLTFASEVLTGMFSVAPLRTVTRQMPSTTAMELSPPSATPSPSRVPFVIVTLPATMLKMLPLAAVFVALSVLPPRSIVKLRAGALTSTRCAKVRLSARTVTVSLSAAASTAPWTVA